MRTLHRQPRCLSLVSPMQQWFNPSPAAVNLLTLLLSSPHNLPACPSVVLPHQEAKELLRALTLIVIIGGITIARSVTCCPSHPMTLPCPLTSYRPSTIITSNNHQPPPP